MFYRELYCSKPYSFVLLKCFFFQHYSISFCSFWCTADSFLTGKLEILDPGRILVWLIEYPFLNCINIYSQKSLCRMQSGNTFSNSLFQTNNVNFKPIQKLYLTYIKAFYESFNWNENGHYLVYFTQLHVNWHLFNYFFKVCIILKLKYRYSTILFNHHILLLYSS